MKEVPIILSYSHDGMDLGHTFLKLSGADSSEVPFDDGYPPKVLHTFEAN